MNIAFFCIPAHGHTNPTLAVVRELTARGHTVRYYTTEAFRAKVETAGAVFVPFDAEAARPGMTAADDYYIKKRTVTHQNCLIKLICFTLSSKC